MFHIVFSSDENYIKYLSVLLTSIIKHTDTSKAFRDYMGGGAK
ncbi:hypothetical protein OQH61_03965 [Helicobacter sp. MIT 21-1697]|nr:hypothetical protein [Helicobacter sp. MIT 21-1697]MCX2716887.1 hypothetical protein [Helicobacter sp. MIT 21-1697]